MGIQVSQASIAPIHGKVKDYLNDSCMAFKRDRHMFDLVTVFTTSEWFEEVQTESDCAQLMCDNRATTYSYYPLDQAGSSGNCKIFYGDLLGGVHKGSSKTGLSHGALRNND